MSLPTPHGSDISEETNKLFVQHAEKYNNKEKCAEAKKIPPSKSELVSDVRNHFI
jgi:hypothetical protein